MLVLAFLTFMPHNGPIHIIIETDKGNITAELYTDQAPKTAANFLAYVDAKLYDGGIFHRAVTLQNQPNNKIKIEVIQGSMNQQRLKEERPPIALERTSVTKLKHLDGTLSMAREGPDSATQEFFICIGPQPELDFAGTRNPDGQGFAAFGKVTQGMDIVKAIQNAPSKEQALTPPITIKSIRRKQ